MAVSNMCVKEKHVKPISILENWNRPIFIVKRLVLRNGMLSISVEHVLERKTLRFIWRMKEQLLLPFRLQWHSLARISMHKRLPVPSVLEVALPKNLLILPMPAWRRIMCGLDWRLVKILRSGQRQRIRIEKIRMTHLVKARRSLIGKKELICLQVLSTNGIRLT